MEKNGAACACPCHRTMGVLVVAFGLVFLLGALDVLSARAVSLAWPVIVILVGLKKLAGGMCKCCPQG